MALQLWGAGVHEARILALMVEELLQITPGQMEAWVKYFNSWDVCGQICGSLFDRTNALHGI